jgi:CDP-diacylglycerol--glycerol-3-phosphate 3-phosphatidyltransferase
MQPIWALPNLLSIARIVVAPVLYALIVSSWRYQFFTAFVLFVAASITDTLDGRIARARGLVSPLGVFLDTTADKILVTVVLVGLAVAGLAPGWMAAVIIAREFLVTGLRSYAAALGVVIPAGSWGKAKTAITIAAIGLVLLSGDVAERGVLGFIPRTAVQPFAGLSLANWVLLLAVVWTIGSGVEYVRGAFPLLMGTDERVRRARVLPSDEP